MRNKVYSKIDSIPKGRASDKITGGCLVLEGGGWKGLYTVGVLDCLMLNDINLSSVVGVSAGALSAIGYLSGQIGWSARIDLTYRHDSDYCGIGALRRDHGITGFSYLFNDLLTKHPVDMERLMDPRRKFAVSATDMATGDTTYFEKGKCDLFKAVQACCYLIFNCKLEFFRCNVVWNKKDAFCRESCLKKHLDFSNTHCIAVYAFFKGNF